MMVKNLVQKRESLHEVFLYGSVDFNGMHILFEKSEEAGALPPEVANARQLVFLDTEKPAVLRPRLNPTPAKRSRGGPCPR